MKSSLMNQNWSIIQIRQGLLFKKPHHAIEGLITILLNNYGFFRDENTNVSLCSPFHLPSSLLLIFFPCFINLCSCYSTGLVAIIFTFCLFFDLHEIVQ